MAKGDKVTIPVDFYVNSVRKEEYRDPSVGIENSYNIGFIDNKKKDRKENDWTPCSGMSLCVMNDILPKIDFGKKYKVTFEEI